jgi:uncharacterized protein (DUF697 family)/GTP-binding protein EngB required for normal cell division
MSQHKDESENIDFGERFNKEFSRVRSSITKPNILVLGGTGTGKSSLVNLVFGDKLATVGAGRPVTKGIRGYENDLVRIYDSEGYESGEASQENYKKTVLDFIKDEGRPLEKQVHLAWYCISLPNHRVFDVDINTVNRIHATRKPIAVVLTQADQVSEEDSAALHAEVQKSCPGVTIFEASTDPTVGLKIDPLIDWAYENLDSALREGFASAAKSGIKQKRAESFKVVAQHAASAAAAAASPIPFSDAPLLVANQITMIARLASIWDLPAIKSFAAGGIFSQVISQLGRTLAGNLLKLIPAAGSLAGGLINASVASTLTGAIGYAVTEICENIVSDDLKGIKKSVRDYFDGELLASLVMRKMKAD